jgi:transcriptional regulator with XRE-family HTH domain
MTQRPLESLGAIVRERRGQRKLREVAREIGISAATLMRIEAGRVPDVATFGKVCKWLKMDPREFLGFDRSNVNKGSERVQNGILSFSAHFKLDKTPQHKTVKALAQMLLLAARTQPVTHED